MGEAYHSGAVLHVADLRTDAPLDTRVSRPTESPNSFHPSARARVQAPIRSSPSGPIWGWSEHRGSCPIE